MRVLLIDAHSFIHRAFHALPPFTGPGGKPTGALYGLTNTLLRVLAREKPDCAIAAFDRPEPTFRKTRYENYKAHRPKAPEELITQIKEAPNLFRTMGVKTFEAPGFEADDIIATLVEKLRAEKETTSIILTGDLDTLQLVEDNSVVVHVPKKGISEITAYNESAVKDRFGVKPVQLADFKGLVGDVSDNIPGVPGVGPKTAAKLINEYGTLENLFQKMEKDDSRADKLLPWKEQALLSKNLALLRKDVPLEFACQDLTFHPPKKEELIAYLETLGFKSIVDRLKKENESPVENEKSIEKEPKNACSVTLQKDGYEIAYDWKTLIKKGSKRTPNRLFDVKIAAWLLNPDKRDYSLTAITKRLLKQEGEEDDEKTLGDLYATTIDLLSRWELEQVFNTIEMPLIPVIAHMETAGIGVNKERLKTLKKTLTEKCEDAEDRVHKEAGSNFNLNSPKQIGEVLYGTLGLQAPKRTATGKNSTSEEALAALKDKHPVIEPLLAYRELSKILRTYVDPLLTLEQNGRIYTTFLQTGTATGRLSSEKPNLQNIPAKGEWAKPLRDAFEAREGYSLLSYDYSQLELRILAHVSKDPLLSEAFMRGEDIHRTTASKIFGVPEESVTTVMRRIGKTLNFGIVYGMGARSLSKTGNVPLEEAERFLKEYFENFPGIKPWQEKIKQQALTLGYAETETKRKRWFPKTSNPRVIAEIGRMAVNMPIQGLNADILKKAMIGAYALIKEKGWLNTKTFLLLSIHDELLLEVADDIVEDARGALKRCMENAYHLSVPLAVETKQGKRWGSMN